MTEQATRHGLRIYPKYDVPIAPDPDGVMHDSRGDGLTRFYRRKVRFWPKDRPDKPVIHESVLQRHRGKHNEDDPRYHPWILDEEYEVEPWNESWRPTRTAP